MYNLSTLFIGRQLLHLPTCHSTNDVAWEALTQPTTQEGLVVVTDCQTAGRGQRNNTWEAEPFQNLTFSVVLKPHFLLATQQFWLNIAVSVGIYNGLQKYLPNDLYIKWPNDIYYKNNKIAGILIQNMIQQQNIRHSVVGIGLNVNQTKFQNKQATSLKKELGENISLNELLGDLLKFLEVAYLHLRNGHFDRLKQSYIKAMYWYQEVHTFQANNELFEGCILGFNEQGQLCVERAGKLHYFSFKEIEYLV